MWIYQIIDILVKLNPSPKRNSEIYPLWIDQWPPMVKMYEKCVRRHATMITHSLSLSLSLTISSLSFAYFSFSLPHSSFFILLPTMHDNFFLYFYFFTFLILYILMPLYLVFIIELSFYILFWMPYFIFFSLF